MQVQQDSLWAWGGFAAGRTEGIKFVEWACQGFVNSNVGFSAGTRREEVSPQRNIRVREI